MTLAELKELIARANWFERLGTAEPSEKHTVLSSIKDWDRDPNWDWLPTSNDQLDPFHFDHFNECPTIEEKEVYRDALRSLRRLPDSIPDLVVSPHDLTHAARSVAGFAARMAAREIFLEYPEKWQPIMLLYQEGFWPCGKTNDNRIVVL